MSSSKVVFSLQNLDGGWWEVVLSNGASEVTFTASSVPSKSLSSLLKAVRSLLQGASKARCSWDEAYGEYRWRFSCQEKQVLIQLLWFNEIGVKRQTLLQLKCDLLIFARVLLHQVSQFQYQNDDGSAVSGKDSQSFREALIAYEQAEGQCLSQ